MNFSTDEFSKDMKTGNSINSIFSHRNEFISQIRKHERKELINQRRFNIYQDTSDQSCETLSSPLVSWPK